MENVRFVDGKKFMWDGQTYESAEAANEAQRAYQAAGFETHVHEHEGKFFVYTRRVATPTAADASAAR